MNNKRKLRTRTNKEANSSSANSAIAQKTKNMEDQTSEDEQKCDELNVDEINKDSSDHEKTPKKRTKRGKENEKPKVEQTEKMSTDDDESEKVQDQAETATAGLEAAEQKFGKKNRLQPKSKGKKTEESAEADAGDVPGASNSEEESNELVDEKVPTDDNKVTKRETKRAKKATKPSKDIEKISPPKDESPDDDFQDGKPAAKKSAKTKPAAKATSSKKEETAPKPPNRSILQLKITLLDITPPIWRRIQVLNNDTFYNLHEHIKEAMGWISPAGHNFIIHNPKTNKNTLIVNANTEGLTYSAKDRNCLKGQTTKLSKFLSAKGDRILYEFDHAESWMHEIVVEKILPPPGPKAEYPKCTGGKRACPPEECGGVDGYNHLVEVYKNPDHEEYEELITDWLGEFNPGWEPEKFDKKQIFRRVRMWVWAP